MVEDGAELLFYGNVNGHEQKKEITFASLTCLFVEHDLILKLLALLQGVVDAEDDAFAGLRPIKKFTSTALLHDFRPGKSCELAEAIGAVDDGKALRHLSIGQDEVAVWRRRRERKGEREDEDLRF